MNIFDMSNRILNDEDRENLKDIIDLMFRTTPEMMNRKIPRANVQQAFGVFGVMECAHKDDDTLCIGSYEDTCADTLIKLGYKVTCIDPEINYDLHTFKQLNGDKKYGVIFSISVMEHTKDDLEFIQDICDLLNYNGTAIITTDFLEGYNPINKPHFAEKFYTKSYLEDKILPILVSNDCYLNSEPNWVGTPDFEYQGFKYNLATLVFQKVGENVQ
jgi:hypothetical protein